jgi:hypothetical protein
VGDAFLPTNFTETISVIFKIIMSTSDTSSDPTTFETQPTSSPAFDSYRAYLDHVSKAPPVSHYEYSKESFWLSQLSSDDKSLQWYRYQPKKDGRILEEFEKCSEGKGAYLGTSSLDKFREQIVTQNIGLDQQIVVISYNEIALHYQVEERSTRFQYYAEQLGLVLDSTPDIWQHMENRSNESISSSPSVAWIEGCRVLDVGQCSLVEVGRSQTRRGTGIVNL